MKTLRDLSIEARETYHHVIQAVSKSRLGHEAQTLAHRAIRMDIDKDYNRLVLKEAEKIEELLAEAARIRAEASDE